MAIQIDAHPHAGQAEVHAHPARFKVLAAGRRWGKTRLGVNECLDVAAKGGRAWWVAPSYKMSEVGWRPTYRMGIRIGADIGKVDRQVTLPGGGWVQVRSADNPDSLRGEGLDFVVFDECAFIQEAAWIDAVRPALSDRQGRALFISTPKGRNWFWRNWVRGQDADATEWKSWRFPTSTNPYIEPLEIEAARGELPQRTFDQEYLAEFIDDAGAVFRNLRACVAEGPAAPSGRNHYVMGVDWAQSYDFTVLTVIERESGRVCALDRFNQIGWDVQRGRLRALAQQWQVCEILAEENSIGGPNIEQLQAEGLPVKGFTTTSQSKQDVIIALQLAFERGEIGIPDDDVLLGELQAFEALRLPSGRWRYEAPEGMHDDCVISLALAWEAANRTAGVQIVRQAANLYGSQEKGQRRPVRTRTLYESRS